MIGRLIPLIAFLFLAVLLGLGLGLSDKKSEIPSPLIGKSIPEFELPVLGENSLSYRHSDLLGEPFLLNAWASWCAACRVEHPLIESLAASGRIRIVGLNYRDEPQDAMRWLERFGDPYELSLADTDGRVAIDFGVYGAPETFLVDAKGQILFKQIGVLTTEAIEQEILPRLQTSGSQ